MVISEQYHWEAAGERSKHTLRDLVNAAYALTPARIALM
jgi:hypothetical protein